MQSLWNLYTSIFLLIVLQDRHQGPAHRETRAIQGMYELRLAPRFTTEADAGAPGLEIAEVRTGRNFTISLLGRQPDFDIEGPCRGEADIGRTKIDHPVRQLECLQDAFGVGKQLVQLGFRILRSNKFDQLDLVELVLANQATGITAMGAGLFAEAGRMRGVADRQLCPVEDLGAKDIGHRHFGGWDQEIVGIIHVEEIGFELRQLPGPGHGVAIDHEGRQAFRILVPWV